MSQYCKLLILSSFYFICGTVCFCQSLSAQHTDNMKGYLNYPLNKSFVMYDFANNITEINQLHSYIKKTLNDPTFIIRKIEVTGYSSPEGSYEHNEKLAQERAENLKNYLHPFFDEQDIRTSYVPKTGTASWKPSPKPATPNWKTYAPSPNPNSPPPRKKRN